jgi:hypothetical protein
MLVGWEEIVGDTIAELTVNVAVLLVAVPLELETNARNCAPLSGLAVAAVV